MKAITFHYTHPGHYVQATTLLELLSQDERLYRDRGFLDDLLGRPRTADELVSQAFGEWQGARAFSPALADNIVKELLMRLYLTGAPT